MFLNSWGWVLFDLMDHYITNYCIILIGLLQCIAVGWVFEAQETAARSPIHLKSMKILGFFFWFPVAVVCFYSHFAMK